MEVPLDDRVDVRDVQVVSAAFNRSCVQVDQRYWLWNETQGDAISSQIVWLPGEDVELHTREGVIYRFFSPLTLGLTAGKLNGVTDRNDNSVTLQYNTAGLLASANNTSGASLQFVYNNSACSVPVIASVTDHTGRVVTYQYGPGCNLIGVERYGSPWHSYGYVAGNLLTTDTNALGQATTYAYDGSSRVVSMQLPGTVAAQTYNYSTPGVTVVTDPVGRATQVQFDLNSKVTQVANLAASNHVPEALQNLVELMRSAKSEKVRLDATTTLLALAGVRPTEGVEEEKPASLEQQRPAVLLNLFLGSGEQPIRTVSVVDVSPTPVCLE